jgi:cytochrome c-type biogenesis protein CcmH/NrfG
MPARFCAQCGTQALAGAKFCSQCGAPLVPGTSPATDGQWRLTAVGLGTLGAFLIGGLAIWASILSPAPPRPGLGATAARPAAPTEQAGDLPTGHPKVPVPLPEEVKAFIADLATKAKQTPKDTQAWMKLAQVNLRAGQLDPAYYPEALKAFEHVLTLEPRNPEALRGIANVHYDRNEPKQAIRFYERYLAERPDDPSARTDVATMYLAAGDTARAIALYQEVIKKNPSFLQAHYNLAVTYHRQGDARGALSELQIARGLATDDNVRRQIDDMIAALTGGPRPPGAPPGDGQPASPSAVARSPYQSAVETAVRGHPIMGPRIARFEWPTPGGGRVLVQSFPMEGMPPEVREKFKTRLAETLRSAEGSHPVEGPVRLEIADAATGRVMETIVP